MGVGQVGVGVASTEVLLWCAVPVPQGARVQLKLVPYVPCYHDMPRLCHRVHAFSLSLCQVSHATMICHFCATMCASLELELVPDSCYHAMPPCSALNQLTQGGGSWVVLPSRIHRQSIP